MEVHPSFPESKSTHQHLASNAPSTFGTKRTIVWLRRCPIGERRRRSVFGIRCSEREFFIDNLLVRIHFIIEMIWWTGLAPWEF